MTLGKVCRTIWKKTNIAAVAKTTRAILGATAGEESAAEFIGRP
jgi:hypothetical protein